MLAVAPDNTIWVDGKICKNIEQLRRSRTIQRFWQNNGVATIQTASWGNAESIRTIAFDGLAENSWTAIGHQHIGNRCEQRLFQYGVSVLVEKKLSSPEERSTPTEYAGIFTALCQDIYNYTGKHISLLEWLRERDFKGVRYDANNDYN